MIMVALHSLILIIVGMLLFQQDLLKMLLLPKNWKHFPCLNKYRSNCKTILTTDRS